ncbi:insulinase family protein [Curvibacter sp. CHRR-16]|uniref:M16 family metallopeptidase n=1 Tax=Curvibacter sp. CHRR-16 TaxID=2835872 RepID=UPI001BD92FC3|nr:insulinase family protein [Curvibacter sp. CHRR-16]MBT0571331.1 insulinase family protein [Curvibacter sp. CHRR-16]
MCFESVSRWLKQSAVWTCWALLAIHGSHAGAQTPLQWDAKVVRGELPNGLQYFVVPNTAPHKAVQMQLLVKVGSLDETAQQSGVAHMVEHMVFHESQDFPQALHGRIQELGWRIGSQVNAVTNYERTLYMLQLEGAQSQQWDEGLHLLSQIAGGARILGPSLDKERRIVLEEWRGKLGITERMERQRRELLRAGSLYPERPTIGSEAGIRHHSAQTLQQFYRTWYHPNNMALLIVGEVDVAQVQQRIAHWFAAWQRADLPARANPDPVLTPGLRIARMQDPESGSSQVAWVYRFQGDESATETGLRERLLDMATNALLVQQVRRLNTQLPTDVESLTTAKGQIGRTTFTLALAARVSVNGHAQGLRTLLETLERLRRDGFYASDWDNLRTQYQQSNAQTVLRAQQRDNQQWIQLLAEVVTQERILQDPVQKQTMVQNALDSLTLQDINHRLRTWLASADQLLFMMAPGTTELHLPTHSAVQDLQHQVGQANWPALPLATQAQTNTSALPTPPESQLSGSVLARQRFGDVVHWQLSNGDQLVWLQRANQGQTMYFAAESAAGYRLPGHAAWQNQLAQQLGAQSAPQGWSQEQFTRWLQQQPRLDSTQTATAWTWQSQTKASQLRQLWHQYWLRQSMTHISDTALLESTRSLARQISRSSTSSKDQAALAMAAMRWELQSQDAPPDALSLQNLQASSLQTLWAAHTALPVTYYLSGQADEQEVQHWAERYLASLPRRQTDPPAPTAQALPTHRGTQEQVLSIGLEPQASVQAYGATPMVWDPLVAMRVKVLSQALYRALRHELREKENGIYRLRFNLTLNPSTQMLESEIAFTADPERMPQLWQRAQTLLAQPANYIDPAQLPSISQTLQQSEAQRQLDDASWFLRLQLSWQHYRDARYLQQAPQLAAQLSSSSVLDLARTIDLRRDLASVLVYPRP